MKLCLFTDDMSVCIENSKKSTKKLFELLSDYSNVTEYKVNIQSQLLSYVQGNGIWNLKHISIRIKKLSWKSNKIYTESVWEKL
jgi:hypothetical protein